MDIYIISEKVKLDQASNLVTNDNTAIIQLILILYHLNNLILLYRHQEFQFPLLDAPHCGEPASKLSRAVWVGGERKRESLRSCLINLNFCVQKVNTKC